jgi:hypothetical protein
MLSLALPVLEALGSPDAEGDADAELEGESTEDPEAWLEGELCPEAESAAEEDASAEALALKLMVPREDSLLRGLAEGWLEALAIREALAELDAWPVSDGGAEPDS